MGRMLRPLLAVLALSGCVAHVTLPAVPLASAPKEERVRALDELSPVVRTDPGSLMTRPLFPQQQLGFLLLNDGLRVSDPMDLLPAVDAASPTAGFARAYEDAMGKATVWGGAWVAMFVAGVVLQGLALAQIDQHPESSLPLLLGGSGVMLGGLVPMAVALVYGNQAAIERESAFQMYPRNLRQRLGLPLEPAQPAGPPPPEPAVPMAP